MIVTGVTCSSCGHRDVWKLEMSPGVVRIPCMGCKELLDVKVTQEDIGKACGLPASLSMWAGMIHA